MLCSSSISFTPGSQSTLHVVTANISAQSLLTFPLCWWSKEHHLRISWSWHNNHWCPCLQNDFNLLQLMRNPAVLELFSSLILSSFYRACFYSSLFVERTQHDKEISHYVPGHTGHFCALFRFFLDPTIQSLQSLGFIKRGASVEGISYSRHRHPIFPFHILLLACLWQIILGFCWIDSKYWHS